MCNTLVYPPVIPAVIGLEPISVILIPREVWRLYVFLIPAQSYLLEKSCIQKDSANISSPFRLFGKVYWFLVGLCLLVENQTGEGFVSGSV